MTKHTTLRTTALAGLATALLALSGLQALAQQPSPEEQAKQAVGYRQALFKTLGVSMGPVGGMLRNRMPFNAQAAETAGMRIEVLAGMIKQVTATDTSKLVPGTEARPIVWTERADFEAKADALAKAGATLRTTAKGGDQAATMKAMQDVGAACKSCHDKYRDEKN